MRDSTATPTVGLPVLAPEASSRSALADRLLDYLSLTKPRIVMLLLVTALCPMFPAAHGWPRLPTLLAVLVGGALAAGGASSINCWFDRDIDAAMRRTRRRPLPAGRIPSWHALVLGIGLNVLAAIVLVTLANLLAAALAVLGTLIYVFVYTIWLKRSTPQNIVIGGAAGAIPPLVGWASVTGRLDLTALALFGIVFLWTPPHFWSLAQLIRDDYSAARVPMLPVVSGNRSTRVQSLLYAVLLTGVSVVPFATHAAGVVYLVGALILGLGFIVMASVDLVEGRWTRRMFGYSIIYLAGVFALLLLAPFL